MPHPRRAPGIPHIDMFLYALGHGGMASMDNIFIFFLETGYDIRQLKTARLALKRHGYFEMLKRNAYLIARDLMDVAPGRAPRAAAPGRPREPRLDLLLMVLSGDRTPYSAFTRLWAGAEDPGAPYRRAREELLRYGYIEDRYGNWYYYPGPRTMLVMRAGSGEAAVPPSPLQLI